MCKIRLTHEQSLPRHQAYRLVLLQDIYAGACTTTQIDHAVLLVGFDKMSTGQEYWIIRKQWSAGWGDEGYLYLPISADDDTTGGACGILGKMSGNSPVYPFKAGALVTPSTPPPPGGASTSPPPPGAISHAPPPPPPPISSMPLSLLNANKMCVTWLIHFLLVQVVY